LNGCIKKWLLADTRHGWNSCSSFSRQLSFDLQSEITDVPALFFDTRVERLFLKVWKLSHRTFLVTSGVQVTYLFCSSVKSMDGLPSLKSLGMKGVGVDTIG